MKLHFHGSYDSRPDDETANARGTMCPLLSGRSRINSQKLDDVNAYDWGLGLIIRTWTSILGFKGGLADEDQLTRDLGVME